MSIKYYVYGIFKNKEPKLIDIFYVGITERLKIRKRTHELCNDGNNKIKNSYIKKYGCNLFVLWEVENLKEAKEREDFLIRWFGRIVKQDGILTNIKIGEDVVLTKVGIKKMSDSKRNCSVDYRNKKRDQYLSYPLEKILEIIEEWKINPIQSYSVISNKYKIKQSTFRTWIQRYKPEYKNYKNVVIKSICEDYKNSIYFGRYSKFVKSYSKHHIKAHNIKMWYERYRKNILELSSDKEYHNIDDTIKIFEEWENSGLSLIEFARKKGISRNIYHMYRKYKVLKEAGYAKANQKENREVS